jgi:hypothetical protein
MPGDPDAETPLARLLRLTARQPVTARDTDDADLSIASTAAPEPVRFVDPLAALSALVRLSAMRDGPG